MDKKTTLYDVERLMRMLTGGELPRGMRLREQPQLSRRAAFSVVWYLQEHMRILPEYEMCDTCGILYDAESCAWGYVDPDDEWGDVGLTQAQVDSVAHQHFCSGACMFRAIEENR